MKLTDGDLAFLDGLFDEEGWLGDLPDGAYQAACEDLVRSVKLFDHSVVPQCIRDGADPHDVWTAWMQAGRG